MSLRRLPVGSTTKQHDGSDFDDVILSEDAGFVKTVPLTQQKQQKQNRRSPSPQSKQRSNSSSIHTWMWSRQIVYIVVFLMAATCLVLISDKQVIRSLTVDSTTFLRKGVAENVNTLSSSPMGISSDDMTRSSKGNNDVTKHTQQGNTNNSNNGSTSNTDRPHLLLHVGPQKTGSSTLQSAWDIMSKTTLQEDNYIVQHITPEQGHFVCDIGPWGGFRDCKVGQTLRELVDDAHQQKINLILSDENLDHRFVGPLRDLIDDTKWNVKVVVVYRHIHQWLISWYNQINKTTNIDSDGKVLIDKMGNPYREEHKQWPDQGGVHVKTFTDWYKEYIQYWQQTELIGKHRSVEFHNLYQSAFPNEVVVYNMNEVSSENFVSDFMCNIVQDATKSCAALQNNEIELPTVNPSVKLSHDILAVAAYEMGLINKNLSRQYVVAEVTKYVNENNVQFPIECDSDAVDQIRDWFLGSEATMFPDSWSNEKRDELLNVFESFLAKGKLCNVDVVKTLEDENWKIFFRSLTQPQEATEEEESQGDSESTEEATTEVDSNESSTEATISSETEQH